MTKKRNKKIAILETLRDHPKMRVAEIAKKFGVHVSHVYALRKKISLPQPAPDWVVNVSTSDPAPQATDVDTVLDSRAVDYGKFIEGAEIMQMLKRMVHNYVEQRGTPLAFDQREAIDMIIHKLGRIINGNPDKVDHWTDIAGYAKLVADRLEGRVR